MYRGILLAFEVDMHAVPLSYIESLSNNECLLKSCGKLISECQSVEEKNRDKYSSYASKSLKEINRDLAFLSLAFFNKDNLISTSDGELVIQTRKYSINESKEVLVTEVEHKLKTPTGVLSGNPVSVVNMHAQGKYIVLDVIDTFKGIEFKYNLLLNLKERLFTPVTIVHDIDKPVMLLNDGKSISLVNSSTFIPLHKVVSAHPLQTLDFALSAEEGLVYVLKATVSKTKFRVYLILGLEEDIMLDTFITDSSEYSNYVNNIMQSGVLELKNGYQISCSKYHSLDSFILNDVRRY
jgi:hypothetical protein